MSESDFINKIFEMVETKRAEKPKRKKKEMTPEARERMLSNLKKGRETSLAKRRAKMAEKVPTSLKPSKNEPVKPLPETTADITPEPAPKVEVRAPTPVPASPAPPAAEPAPPAVKPAPPAVKPAPVTPRAPTPPPEPYSMSTYGESGSFW